MQAAAAPPSNLLSERLALAHLGLSLDGTPSRALEAGWNGATHEEDDDEDDNSRLVVESGSRHHKPARMPRPGGDAGGGAGSMDPGRRPATTEIDEAAIYTAQAVSMRRHRVSELRRMGTSSLPPRGSLDHMDRRIDEVEGQWRRTSVLPEAQMAIVAGNIVADPQNRVRPSEPELMVDSQSGGFRSRGTQDVTQAEQLTAHDRLNLGGARNTSRRQYSAYTRGAKASVEASVGNSEKPGYQPGEQTRNPAKNISGLLTENRKPTSPTFPKRVPLPGQNQELLTGGPPMLEEDGGVHRGILANTYGPTPAVLVPGQAAFPMPPMSDLAPAADGDDDGVATTVSPGPEYADDDDRSLFLPPSAAQRRARANALFLPPLPLPVPEASPPDGPASSPSLDPTAFGVQVPTPPARSTERADDRASILPSAQRRSRQGLSGAADGSNHRHNNPPAMRRSRGHSAQLEPRPVVRYPPSSSAGLGRASAVAACRVVVTAETPVPAVLVPGQGGPAPRLPPRVRLAPERHGEGQIAEDEQWSSASEGGPPWYGSFPRADGDDWKSRWMRCEGDFR